MGFSKPSRVQAQTLPLILTGPPFRRRARPSPSPLPAPHTSPRISATSLIAQAHNGSGKTTCFVLGMLSRVDPSKRSPQALCLCPTRELVNQNVEVMRKMATHTAITCATTAAAEGGAATSRMAPITDQLVFGTPGTVNSWLQRRTLPARCARGWWGGVGRWVCAEGGGGKRCRRMQHNFPTGADTR